eukprot:g2053.t1
MWNAVVPGMIGTMSKFSAICWYTGVSLFEGLGGKVPVGLIAGAVGGSAIEFWLPPGHVNSSAACGVDSPPCDNGGTKEYRDSDFYDQLIKPFAPYTIGTTIWDQGERDTHCLPQHDGSTTPENHVARYACLLRQLVQSWRAAFDPDHAFGFLAVQLPGYLGDCGTYEQCAATLFPMRLQQQAGVAGLNTNGALATTLPTYDLSCPPGNDSSTKTVICPFGTVHNVFKRPLGARIASQILGGMAGRQQQQQQQQQQRRQGQWPGPKLVSVKAGGIKNNAVTVNVTYAVPLVQRKTLNCVACCAGGPASVGDFDVTFDDAAGMWHNGTRPVLTADKKTLQFRVGTIAGSRVTHVRYTGNQPFPQCAVYALGDATGVPAMPFLVNLTDDGPGSHANSWAL